MLTILQHMFLFSRNTRMGQGFLKVPSYTHGCYKVTLRQKQVFFKIQSTLHMCVLITQGTSDMQSLGHAPEQGFSGCGAQTGVDSQQGPEIKGAAFCTTLAELFYICCIYRQQKVTVIFKAFVYFSILFLSNSFIFFRSIVP